MDISFYRWWNLCVNTRWPRLMSVGLSPSKFDLWLRPEAGKYNTSTSCYDCRRPILCWMEVNWLLCVDLHVLQTLQCEQMLVDHETWWRGSVCKLSSTYIGSLAKTCCCNQESLPASQLFCACFLAACVSIAIGCGLCGRGSGSSLKSSLLQQVFAVSVEGCCKW